MSSQGDPAGGADGRATTPSWLVGQIRTAVELAVETGFQIDFGDNPESVESLLLVRCRTRYEDNVVLSRTRPGACFGGRYPLGEGLRGPLEPWGGGMPRPIMSTEGAIGDVVRVVLSWDAQESANL